MKVSDKKNLFVISGEDRHLASFFCIFILFVMFVSLSVCISNVSAQQTSSASGLSYDTTVISEDVTWRGTIRISGSLTIAPQATVRVDPGTRVLFSSPTQKNLARLVVMGRIQATGSSDSPVVFAADNGKWGGILLLSSMKKNQFENCRIESAEIGIEARFSSLSTIKIHIINSNTAMLLFDSVASSSSDSISQCITAYTSSGSDLELRNSKITNNQQGMQFYNSSVVINNVLVKDNKNCGVLVSNSRLNMTNSIVSENAVGMEVRSGEGEIRLSRFSGNSDAGLRLTSSSLKVTRCQIIDNAGDGIQLHDDRPTIWGNSIYGNSRYNILYTGKDPASIVQNWWGTVDDSTIMRKISDSNGGVKTFPFLMASPLP